MHRIDSSLSIPLRPSMTLKWIWISSGMVTLSVFLFLPMDWHFRLIFLIAWLIFAGQLSARWRKLAAVRRLSVTENGFSIATEFGTEDAQLSHAPYVTYPLMILQLKTRRERLSLICLPDSAHEDDLRRLRVWLSLRGGK